MSKQNPVNELADKWFQVEGISFHRSQFGFIGKLYKQYGRETVLKAINKVRARDSQATDLRSPNLYLRGICRQLGASGEAVNHEGRAKLEAMFKGIK
ncbi:hypothetical protein LC065_20095 (plasmid) [Halobacillus litoralis]|uniref:hypothetical protein n=1 Tax=Halobacillus litoralis TaxID=45668 RepID=UPI001CFCA8EC|nr:hypothetical protein [Halobacillus litoralis]WLR49610.1 hypothetical protein LC065_20095 [Halobacillus litoralis]